jgi:P4 family phage/plasmid primase-like protien
MDLLKESDEFFANDNPANEASFCQQLKNDFANGSELINLPVAITEGVLDQSATETQLAALLRSKLPPVRCVGRDWFVYRHGVWEKTSADEFAPSALSIQHIKSRTAQKATNILKHVELASQVTGKDFKSFHFEAGGELYINCADCVLVVPSSGSALSQLPHSETYLFTRQMAAKYNPEATCPNYDATLQAALPDPADIELFRCFAGYMLLPDSRHEVALVCYGETRTGKGTVSAGIEAALGDKLVTAISLSQLSNPENKNLAKLAGAALNLSCELDAVEVTSEFFKQLVSGESIDVDRKYRDSISLRSTCKFMFSANHLPRFKTGTDAELRRLLFLRFAKQVHNPDETLKDRIRSEADAVFLFMLDGLRALLAKRTFPTGGLHSIQTREQFRLQNDPVNAFIERQCRLGLNLKIQKDELHQAYTKFCDDNSLYHAEGNSWFFRELFTRHSSLKTKRASLDGHRFHEIEGIELKADV